MIGGIAGGLDSGLVIACATDGVTVARVAGARLVSHRRLRQLPWQESPSDQTQLAVGDIVLGRVTRIDRPRRTIFVDLGHGATGMVSGGMVSGGKFAVSEGDRLQLRLAETAAHGKQPRLTILAVQPISPLQPMGLLARGGDGLELALLSLPETARILTNDGVTKSRVAQWLGKLGRAGLVERLELRLVAAETLLEQTGVAEQWEAAQERIQPQPNRSRLILEEAATLQIIDVDRGGCDLTTVALNCGLAAEIARLIGLRRWGGLIVIDFLRMKLDRERAEVWQSLKNQTPADGDGWALHGFTRAGLFEITRPNRGKG